jgi:hypothetical protein
MSKASVPVGRRMMIPCEGVCNFCYPDAVHDCVRPNGHPDWHSCQPVLDDEITEATA